MTGYMGRIGSKSISGECNANCSLNRLLGLAMDSKLFMPEPNYDTTEDELCIDMTKSWISSKRCLDIILAAPRHGTQSRLPSWCPDFLNAGNQPFDEDMVHYLTGRAERFRLGEKRTFWNVTKDSSRYSRPDVHAYWKPYSRDRCHACWNDRRRGTDSGQGQSKFPVVEEGNKCVTTPTAREESLYLYQFTI